MKLIEIQEAKVSHDPVDPKDPEAIRAQFVGTPPAEFETRHPDYKPSGELMPGEHGHAKPTAGGDPRGLWHFTSDRGFTMVCPPHDLRRDPSDEKYPMLRAFDTDMENLGIGLRR